MPYAFTREREPGFVDPDCTCLGTCDGHTDDSALAFVYVNLLPIFIGSCKISAQSVVLRYCTILNNLFRAGRMPTPQENLLFAEQASCLFLRMLQDVSCPKTASFIAIFSLKLALPLNFADKIVDCLEYKLNDSLGDGWVS
ncbi:hypothetical protein QUA35_15975 [Microcoleus sp. N9_B2]